MNRSFVPSEEKVTLDKFGAGGDEVESKIVIKYDAFRNLSVPDAAAIK